MLPDRKTRLALGGFLSNVVLYFDSRRGPIPAGGTWQDLTGYNHNGAGYGGAYVESGNGLDCGSAAQYWGMTVADSDLLSFGDAVNDVPFALSIWINPSSMATTQYFFNKMQSSSLVEYAFAFIPAGNMYLLLYDLNINSRIAPYTVAGAVTVGWQHWFITYDASGVIGGIKFYRNGQPIAHGGNANSGSYTAMHNTAISLAVGYYGYNPSDVPFVGKLDQVMLLRGSAPPQETAVALYESQRHLFGV